MASAASLNCPLCLLAETRVPAHVAGLDEAKGVVDAQGREHADVTLGEHLDLARALRWCCRRELDFCKGSELRGDSGGLDVCFCDSCARSARAPMLAGVVSDRSAHDRTKNCDHGHGLISEAALLDWSCLRDKYLGCLFGEFTTRGEGGSSVRQPTNLSFFPSNFCKISQIFLKISRHFSTISVTSGNITDIRQSFGMSCNSGNNMLTFRRNSDPRGKKTASVELSAKQLEK